MLFSNACSHALWLLCLMIIVNLLVICFSKSKYTFTIAFILEAIYFGLMITIISITGLFNIDYGWDLLFIEVEFVVSLIVINISLVLFKNKLSKNTINKVNYYYITFELVLLIYIISLPLKTCFSEMATINNADYIVTYNEQNGIVISEDYFYAIKNGHSTKISIRNFENSWVKYNSPSYVYCIVSVNNADIAVESKYEFATEEVNEVLNLIGDDTLKYILEDINYKKNINEIDIGYYDENILFISYNRSTYMYKNNKRVAIYNGSYDKIYFPKNSYE